MSAHKRFGNYPCRIGDILLRQVSAVNLRTNNSKAEPIIGGNIDRSAVITAFAEPEVMVTTGDFTGVFGGNPAISISTGYVADVNLGSPTAASLFQMQRRVDGGTFEAANSLLHNVLTSNKGFAYIDSISAEQDSQSGAAIEVAYKALSVDGLTAPLSHTAISALTSTPSYNNLWFLGPVWLDVGGTETQILGVTRTVVRPGIECGVSRAEGEPYAQVSAIMSRKPEITITTKDLHSVYANLNGLFGKPLAVGVTLYYQAGSHGGSRVAKATTSHVKVVASTSDSTVDSISVQEQDDGTAEITIRPNSVLALTTGVAIYEDS